MFAKAMLMGSSQAGLYKIGESLRFNDDDNAYLSRTPASAGDRTTWTWSAWVKLGNLGIRRVLFAATNSAGNDYVYLEVLDTNALMLNSNNGSASVQVDLRTNAVFRDPSAWYHVALIFDTSQAVSTDRAKIYVNGVQQTSFSTATYPPLNYNGRVNLNASHNIGSLLPAAARYFDGYMSDVYFIDGQALDPTSFGKEDADGIWQPISYTGSYGTNGFHLDFANRKYDGSSASLNNLGLDSSGNGNNWTASGLTTYRDGLGDYVANTTLSGTTYSDRTVDKLFNGIAVDNNDNSAPFNCLEFSAQPGSVTFSPAITATSSIKMWVASFLGGDKTVKINGTNFTFTSTSAYNTPATLYTLPVTTLTSIEVDTAGANDTRFYGIVVDDVLLVDQYADIVSNEDSVDDTPSVNYATWNPLDNNGGVTLSNGNLDFSGGATAVIRGTMAGSGEKFYWEITNGTNVGPSAPIVWGIANASGVPNTHNNWLQAAYFYTDSSASSTLRHYQSGSLVQSVTIPSALRALVSGDVLQVAYDGATGKVWMGVNDVWADNSGGTTGDPAAGTNQTFTFNDPSIEMTALREHAGVAWSGALNCGQRPFAYTPPTGFQALNSSNLPVPTIKDGSKHFEPILYTGNGTTQSISGLEFQPDFVWIKNRDAALHHVLSDAVRGAQNALFSSTTLAEFNSTINVTAFNSNGFSVGSGNNTNASGQSLVAWNWYAGGSTVTNNDGTITSQVRANTDAGFSIVSYTGNGTAGATVGHGLTQVPEMVVVKRRNNTGGFLVYNKQTLATKYLALNLTAAATTLSTVWNNTEPTSSVFSIGTDAGVNGNTDTFISYCFHSVDGFSKFGTYTGNGSTDGPFVYTGFRPAFVLVKRTDTADGWIIQDSARDSYNATDKDLYPHLSNAEATALRYDFLSNGFKQRNTFTPSNASGGTYIYMAFAENPFKKARAR